MGKLSLPTLPTLTAGIMLSNAGCSATHRNTPPEPALPETAFAERFKTVVTTDNRVVEGLLGCLPKAAEGGVEVKETKHSDIEMGSELHHLSYFSVDLGDGEFADVKVSAWLQVDTEDEIGQLTSATIGFGKVIGTIMGDHEVTAYDSLSTEERGGQMTTAYMDGTGLMEYAERTLDACEQALGR